MRPATPCCRRCRLIDALLNHADLALYAAKSAGRGDFCFFVPQMAAVTRRRLAVEQGLRHALALGLHIALDDFGTDCSSLGYLRRFAFDTLKIDRSFVMALMSRRDARAIVTTIVSLARTLNRQIVAEAIEGAEQVDVLHRYGCDALQGFLLARPMAAAHAPSGPVPLDQA